MQKRYWSFKDDDATASLIRWFTGLHRPGLYFGFDFNPTANLNLNLNHLTTGFKDVDSAEVESNFQGMLITRQGTVIVEDSALTINGIAAGDATHPRIDIVVCTHIYDAVVGGSSALYSVITGTPAALPVAPALANPNTQIKIGELLIPAGTAALNAGGVTWTRMPCPTFAGQDIITPVVGSRVYSEQNLVTTAQTITASIEALDKAWGRKTSGDLDSVVSPGVYHVTNGAANIPSGMTAVAQMIVSGQNGSSIRQRIIDLENAAEWVRQFTAPSTWTAWVLIRYASKQIDIGDWDMVATGKKVVPHGLAAGVYKRIRRVEVWIRDDADGAYSQLDHADVNGGAQHSGKVCGGVWLVQGSSLELYRASNTDTSLASTFDSVNYDSTGYNRGFITIEWIP